MWLVADPLLGTGCGSSRASRRSTSAPCPWRSSHCSRRSPAGACSAVLERFGVRRARAIWTGVAGAVLAGSFLPFIGDAMEAAPGSASL
ncbi:hypothetical protein AB0H94_37080 [Streptomyces purpurascens]|uniref:hypothetical protein n=1 Tax=Streptomyces purpurascens TaxID=1924 RepID=UPI0033EAC8ED